MLASSKLFGFQVTAIVISALHVLPSEIISFEILIFKCFLNCNVSAVNLDNLLFKSLEAVKS